MPYRRRSRAPSASPAHRKAADYTLARIRLGHWQMAFGAVTLLGWTLFGGLDLLNRVLLEAILPHWGRLAYGVALFGAVVGIEGLLHVPLDLYGTFGIEARSASTA
jgi:STE24 endopeptidase